MRGGTASPGRYRNTGRRVVFAVSRFSSLPRGTLLVLEAINMAQLTQALCVHAHFRAVWTTINSLSVSDVLNAYGHLVSGSHFSGSRRLQSTVMRSFLGDPFRKCFRIQFYFVRQWILVASVYGLFFCNRDRYAQCKLCPVLVFPFTPFPDKEVAALVVFNCGMAGFAWYDAPLAVLSFHAVFCSFVGRPKIFGIVVDVDWKPCTSPWRSHRCSSWTSLTCPLFWDRYVQCCLCTDRGDPTGAVLGNVIDMPVVVHVKVV